MVRVPRRLAGIGADDMENASEFDAYIGPSREVTVDPARGIVALHDGSTPGGKRVIVGQIITPQMFGAKGDGVTNDTTAWNLFQAAVGLKFVPAGEYLANGVLKTFEAGVIGNANYDYAVYAHPELTTDGGNKLKESFLVYCRTIDNGEDSLYSGPAIVTQTHITLEIPDTATGFTDFKQFYGSSHELILDGYYDFDDDGNHNYSTGVYSTRNRMAGMMGSTALCAYSYDAKETENADILTMGATKTGTMYLQTIRRAKYASGGYTLGLEIYSLNQSDDVGIPYTNNDTGTFTSFDYSLKLTAGGNGAPITNAIAITGLNDPHGYYNGINIGGSAFKVNGDTQGATGTVSISLVTQRAATGFSEHGIKYGENKRHHYYVRENAKSRSSQHRFIYETGDAGLSIEAGASSSYETYIDFRDGADTSKDANYASQVARAKISASRTAFTLTSSAGVVRLKPTDTAAAVGYEFNTVRAAPYQSADGIPHLGGADRRWNTVYATNATINTSDEREKTKMKAIPDAALDAWGEVDYGQYQMLDAVAAKGDAARLHTGVIAQRVIEAFKKHKLDASRYGLLCYDEWEATPEERSVSRVKISEPEYEQILFREAGVHKTRVVIKDAEYEQILVKPAYTKPDGTEVKATYKNGPLISEAEYEDKEHIIPAEYIDGPLIKEAEYHETVTVIPASPAGNLYGIRYEEALVMEAAYQRRRADRIEDRLSTIEKMLSKK